MKSSFHFTDGRTLEVGTMYCIGRNYAAHAKEMGAELPDVPIIFLKPASAFVGIEHTTIEIPSISQNMHHELEVVVVLGKDASRISAEEAVSLIAGYGVGLDLTLRDVQAEAKKKGEPWAVAKGFRGAAPISSIIPAEVFAGSVPHFDIELSVNGTLRQKGNTTQMERSIPQLIAYLSQIFDLRAGDCIFTGTPEGVAKLSDGDECCMTLSYGETTISRTMTVRHSA